mmetsp:Transcript_19754/g.30475  ORF Transcript_19754/g.30475 Transcript_19754/m.30475 type:complete len:474 (+) Transcript_19754:200-1621(+)|eukprot:CAMPEP_0195281572 /NCGR_PEP_ID=MMETSP0707-20130614/829_1 /TAXON_ID=33640 /ORGANISM="Asterionellopsis glacialis, Strain CCMP134" /LENGTH=473 /DNA_ID=CAMNT_0040340475 /DNA_START=152 /DNA_END=1573 /DNA_ORIENTATION=-
MVYPVEANLKQNGASRITPSLSSAKSKSSIFSFRQQRRRKRRRRGKKHCLFSCYRLAAVIFFLYCYFATWKSHDQYEEQLQHEEKVLKEIYRDLDDRPVDVLEGHDSPIEKNNSTLEKFMKSHHVIRNGNLKEKRATNGASPEAKNEPRQDGKNATDGASPEAKYEPRKDFKRYVIFYGSLPGQGEGNIIHGLLAAHLLAFESNRTLCIKTCPKFLNAFRVKDPNIRKECQEVLSQRTRATKESVLTLLNYNIQPVDECDVKKKIMSDMPYIYAKMNTYPRWPPVPDNFFTTYYEPTDALLKILPWQEPPKVVVHLRWQDGAHDKRKGLDNETLDALGDMLPSDTFLVTNKVQLYDKFGQTYGWKSSQWKRVTHSALGLDFATHHITPYKFNDEMNMQLYSDWYSILRAEKVYHTHSDFSLSAVHWMNIESKTILGMEDGKLQLVGDPWKRDGETEPLSQRTKDNLRNCKLQF